MIELEKKVDRLEYLMAQTQLMFQGLVVELRDFKTQTQITINEFKAQTQKSIKEMKNDTKKLKRELAEVSRKMGTLVEDMVAPNIERIGKKYFGLDRGKSFVRVKSYHSEEKSKQKEFDLIAVYDEKIIVNETKSNPKPEYACDFAEFLERGEFFKYFPEYEDKEIIPVFSSVYLPNNIIKYLSRHKIYAMGLKEDTMDILNSDAAGNII